MISWTHGGDKIPDIHVLERAGQFKRGKIWCITNNADHDFFCPCFESNFTSSELH